MKPAVWGFSLALGLASLQAQAVGRLADVTVVDRNSGATLPVHYYRGEYWVAGAPGGRYAIAMRSRLGERVLAVTSVDGVNVLNGETAAWEQGGYVLSPLMRYQITGWRKSSSEVAAFEFSAAGDSYAGRTGRPDHVGVIGVALFRERLPEPVAQLAPEASGSSALGNLARRERADNAPPPAAPADGFARGGPASDTAEKSASSLARPGDRQAEAAAQAAPAPRLGTAHGQRETSVVSHTSFQRLQAQPDEVVRIRYDSRENLVAAGVIREPIARLPNTSANPFPLSGPSNYVPDPPPRLY